ncbi:MAG: GTPase Era [Mesosutterella sp.]|nr:GTPase Era [Mesosutterella sp.]
MTEEKSAEAPGQEGIVLPPARKVPAGFRCGYIAVVGRPNVGKSTLINRLVGEKVSITSHKPQTTRDRALGVLTREDAQYIFVDTPGFQSRYKSGLTHYMNNVVRGVLTDVNVVLFVIDASGWKGADEEVLRLVPRECSVILVLNKTDELKNRDALLPLMALSMQKFPFAAIVPTSAKKGTQCEELLTEIRRHLPEDGPYYDPDLYTDKSPRYLAAETVREKAFRLLGDELPYGIAVTIDKWEEDERHANIVATLLVERESHRPIVIGEKGAKLREISRLARADIEQMLGKPTHLEVWVRVRRGWSDDARALKTLGYS